MATNEEGRSFAARYAARRSQSDDEVSEWVHGRGSVFIAGVFIVLAVWLVVNLIVGG
jgi:hypothetical protein